jgi:meso-butanediol dehydrogenase/(S,S)-butanediol dehydrogenase/diacetyl reductase
VTDNDPYPLAVVTGGTSGIGLAVADRLMTDGYDVLVTGRNVERGAQAVAQLMTAHQERQATFLALDSTRWSDYGKLTDAVRDRCVHAVVASAAFGLQAHVTDTDPTTFLDIMAVNVAAPLCLVEVLRPRLADPSSVVLISSDAGIDGEQALGAYSVSKAALNMLGRMMALDLAPQVRVNVVCPGDTVPGMRYLLRPGERERAPDDYLSWTVPPRGRLGTAHDTAEFVAFLVSPRSDFMVGSVTVIDGGSRAGRPDPSGLSPRPRTGGDCC